MTPQAQTSERERLLYYIEEAAGCDDPAWYEALEQVCAIARADAEKIRALEADAARYAWLKTAVYKDCGDLVCAVEGAYDDFGMDLDAAVDDAISPSHNLAATQSTRSEVGKELPEVMSPNEYPLYLQNIDD